MTAHQKRMSRRKSKDTEGPENDISKVMGNTLEQAILFQYLYNELSSSTPNYEELEMIMTKATRATYKFSNVALLKRCKSSATHCVKFGRYKTLVNTLLGMTGFAADVFGDAWRGCHEDASDRILEHVFQGMLRALPAKTVTWRGQWQLPLFVVVRFVSW
jgi:hypothetical protein